MSPDYNRAVPTIDLTDDEHAAVTAAIRRAIETDGFPRAPRLDPLRSALARLEAAAEPGAQPKASSAGQSRQAGGVARQGAHAEDLPRLQAGQAAARPLITRGGCPLRT